jgi:general secretion pathway protein J
MKTWESGFTLLELLVALVVLGFVLAGITGGVQFGQRATTMQVKGIAAHVDLDSADRILRRLVAGMDPGSATEPPRLSAGPTALGFTTDLSQAAAALPGDGQADIGLGVDAAHRLVLRWTPALHGVQLAPPPVPATAVLLDGVERVEFAYWGDTGSGGRGWVTNWTGKDIPPLVRIRLLFPADSQRHWPDIIAPTERLRPG